MARLPDGLILIAKSMNKETGVIFDQRELVMCRNCCHYIKDNYGDCLGWCGSLEHRTNDDWFCADGERECKK